MSDLNKINWPIPNSAETVESNIYLQICLSAGNNDRILLYCSCVKVVSLLKIRWINNDWIELLASSGFIASTKVKSGIFSKSL